MSGKAYLVVALVCLSVYTTQGKLYCKCPSVSLHVYLFVLKAAPLKAGYIMHTSTVKFYTGLRKFFFVGGTTFILLRIDTYMLKSSNLKFFTCLNRFNSGGSNSTFP